MADDLPNRITLRIHVGTATATLTPVTGEYANRLITEWSEFLDRVPTTEDVTIHFEVAELKGAA